MLLNNLHSTTATATTNHHHHHHDDEPTTTLPPSSSSPSSLLNINNNNIQREHQTNINNNNTISSSSSTYNNNNNNYEHHLLQPVMTSSIGSTEHLQPIMTNNNNIIDSSLPPSSTHSNSSSSTISLMKTTEHQTKFQKFKFYLKFPLKQSSKCITIMNVLLILFILQGLFGLFSSFILLYTTGDNLIVQSRSNQKLQMKSVINYEIGEMVKSTTLIMNQLLYQLKSTIQFDLNNNLNWFRIMYNLKLLNVHKTPLNMIYFGRFDQSFIGVEYDYVRVLVKYDKNGNNETSINGISRLGTDYHLISDPNLIFSPNNVIETKNWTLVVTDRAWYNLFTKYQHSNKTLSNVKWSPVFLNIKNLPHITLSMPMYINTPIMNLPTNYTSRKVIPYFQSTFGNSNQNGSNNSLPFVTLNKYLLDTNYGKNTQIVNEIYPNMDISNYLYGSLSVQLSLTELTNRLNQSTIEAGVALTLIINPDGYIIACTDLKINSLLLNQYESKYAPNNDYIIHSILNHSISDFDFLNKIKQKSPAGSGSGSTTPGSHSIELSSITITDLNSYTYQSQSINNLRLDISLYIITDSHGLTWGALIGVEQLTFVEQVLSSSLSSVLTFIGVLIVGSFILFMIIQSVQVPLRSVKKQLFELVKHNLNDDIDKNGNTINGNKNGNKNGNTKNGNNGRIFSLFNDIRQMQQSMNLMKRGIDMFSKYVPSVLVRKIYHLNEIKKQQLTILNITINGNLDNTINGNQLISYLSTTSEYYSILSTIIEHYNGIINKFNGQSLLALFNNDQLQPLKNHEFICCQCSMAILKSIEKLNKNGNTINGNTINGNINVQIGINSGEMLCGNLYSQTNINFAVLGEQVNLTSKIQHLNNTIFSNSKYSKNSKNSKYSRNRILINENTFDCVKNEFICYFVDYISFGEHEKIKVYSLECSVKDCTPKQIECRELFDRLDRLYCCQNEHLNRLGECRELLSTLMNGGEGDEVITTSSSGGEDDESDDGNDDIMWLVRYWLSKIDSEQNQQQQLLKF